MIEKYSSEEQLFQCYTPVKRRFESCMETVTSLKKIVKSRSNEDETVRKDLRENVLDATNKFE